jgi:hypothetical protein
VGLNLPPELQRMVEASRGPDGTQPPDPAVVQQVVTTLATTPTPPPAQPSVTTPAPPVAQVKDQVQAALNQLPKTPV